MPAKYEDEIYNLLTKEVMTEKSVESVERDQIGQRMIVEFVIERLTEGRFCVWDKMTNKKLKTFKTSNATTEVKSSKDQRGVWTAATTDRHLKKSTAACSEGMHWHWHSTTISICIR